MACGEPPTKDSKHMQLFLCQLCGRDMGSCFQNNLVPNYQKQVDPPAMAYTQIIPDYRYDQQEAVNKKTPRIQKARLEICIPLPNDIGNAKKSENNGTAPAQSQPEDQSNKKVEEKGSKEQTDQGNNLNSAVSKVNRLLLFLLASCLPTGCPPPIKMMLCLPCPPPEGFTGGTGAMGMNQAATSARNQKPRDYTYRCESRELRGGNLYVCCQCIKRNGLQHDCPRTPCQGRPPCLTKPWPDCWPSGGCHGIDYTREKGYKRYDPCSEQRFDKKECRGPSDINGGGGGPAKLNECGGNMMVVVCPPFTQNN